jgi:hypothetical protein
MGGRRWTPWTSSRSQVGLRPTPEPPRCPSDLTDEERRACAAARSGRAPVTAAGAVSAVIPTSPTTAGSRLTHPTAPRRLGPRAGSLRFSPWTPSPAAVSDPRDPRAGLEGHGWSGRLRPACGGLGPRPAGTGPTGIEPSSVSEVSSRRRRGRRVHACQRRQLPTGRPDRPARGRRPAARRVRTGRTGSVDSPQRSCGRAPPGSAGEGRSRQTITRAVLVSVPRARDPGTPGTGGEPCCSPSACG